MTSLIVVRESPLVAESPPSALVHEVTPTEFVYVRSNFPTPALDAATHRLHVNGAVSRQLELSMHELRGYHMKTLVTTMECAGNDRLGMRPTPAGEPWNRGAVSTIEWRGVPLRDVLAAAGVAGNAVEIVAWGADSGAVAGRDLSFARALPLDVAQDPDTLLAFEMNGVELTPDHGYPLRLAVPRWYGMASVKWLSRLEVVTAPFSGYFQRERYVYDVGGRIEPVTRMRVKSIITSPSEHGEVHAGAVEVRGWAWSGDGEIEHVDVYCDGVHVSRAELGTAASRHAWVYWSAVVTLAAGERVLQSRATDATGAVQPDTVEWNRLGYGNNAVRGVRVMATVPSCH